MNRYEVGGLRVREDKVGRRSRSISIPSLSTCYLLSRRPTSHHSPEVDPGVFPVALPSMPIAIMEESTGDQQDVSMEWMSSPPMSPQKNGNVLKRKAEEDLALEGKTEKDVDMKAVDEQEVVIDVRERPSVNGTPEDGKSARPCYSSPQTR